MLCIAAFIVFAFLGIFSATHRRLAGQAWHCVVRRVTLRPCDISFGEEVKAKLVGGLIVRAPRTARFIDRYAEWFATAFVILSIWSLGEVLLAGLNLYVYGTCSPSAVESCSLSGEACGVDQTQISLGEAWNTGQMEIWIAGPVIRLSETISRIPDRMRTWDAALYVSPTATYLRPMDPAKPTALEVIDPGCRFCREMTGHIFASGIADEMNVTYLLYPIPAFLGTKFPHSALVASYIEATKGMTPRRTAGDAAAVPADWRLLERIFSKEGPEPWLQEQFNTSFTSEQAEAALQGLLEEIGFTEDEVRRIATRAGSEDVKASLAVQKKIVEDDIRTIKIPTVIIGGRRYDSVVSEEALKKYRSAAAEE